jgi:hypothetical protein
VSTRRWDDLKATVCDIAQVPYLTASQNEVFTRILTETWPHADVLKQYAELFKSEPPIES